MNRRSAAKIVIGYDGSDGADRAVELAASLPWEQGTAVHVVTATPAVAEVRATWGVLALRDDQELEAEIEVAMAEALEPPTARLRAAGLDAQSAARAGRPAAVLEGVAREVGADWVVVGSRGLGNIASHIVGSVSMETLDRSPCPTIIARATAISSVLLATDGSDDARAAEAALARLPLHPTTSVKVVSVVDQLRPWMTGVAPGWHQRVVATQMEYDAEQRRLHETIVAESVERLHRQGLDVSGEMLEGPAAAVVVTAAEKAHADLVVLGSRGRTGLSRLVLGSVSRHVAHHSAASVLVARHAARGAEEG